MSARHLIPRWLRGKRRHEVPTSDESVSRIRSGRRDVALTSAVALFSGSLVGREAEAVTVAPFPPYSAGRAQLGFIGDGVSVSDPTQVTTPVVFDGREGYFTTTIPLFGNTLTVFTFSSNITIASATPNVVTLIGAGGGTVANVFKDTDVGSWIAIPGAGPAGATLVTQIAAITINGVASVMQVQLATPASTFITNVSTQLTWPCFLPSDVGKTIWVASAGVQHTLGGNSRATAFPLLTTIASYVSPSQVTLTASTPGGMTNLTGNHIVWGTDNTNAIAQARIVAAAQSRTELHFESYGSVSTLCCAFNMAAAASGGSGIIPDAISNAHFFGNNVRSFFTDNAGNRIVKQIIPREARYRGPPAVPRTVIASRDFPRCKAVIGRPIVIAIVGDSLAPWINQQYMTATPQSLLSKIIERSNRNTGRVIALPFNFGVGGQTYSNIDSTIAMGGPPAWWVPQTASWLSFLAAVSPDLVILNDSGGNENQSVVPSAIISVINKIQTSFPKAYGLPPDILMMNSRNGSLGSGGFSTFQQIAGRELANTLIRSMAQVLGLPCIDYYSRASAVKWGWSPNNNTMVQAPAPYGGAGVSAGHPMGFGQYIRDYEIFFRFSNPGVGFANAAAFWALVLGASNQTGNLSLQLGNNIGNCLWLNYSASTGNLTVQVNTWGYAISSACSISSGDTTNTLTITGTVTTTAVTGWTSALDPSTGGTVFTVTGATPFSTGMVGQGIVIQGGQAGLYTTLGITNGNDFRSKIIGYVSSTVVILQDATAITSLGPCNIYTGPMLFTPLDATAHVDIIVPGAGPGGNNLYAKVASYVSRTSVTLTVGAATTLSASTQPMWVGRTCVPLTDTGVPSYNGAANVSPVFRVSIKDTQLQVMYLAIQGYAPTLTCTIASGSLNTLTVSGSTPFSPDMLGNQITIPGAGLSGATLTTFIQSVVSSTSVTFLPAASTPITSSSVVVAMTATAVIAFIGSVERFGGPFTPLLQISGTTAIFASGLFPAGNGCWMVDQPTWTMPKLTDLDAYGTLDNSGWYGGNGLNHPSSLQTMLLDYDVLEAQDWALGPLPTSGFLVGLGITANSRIDTQSLPIGAIITNIDLTETAGHAVTGGVNVGTSPTGAQVVSAQPVGASGFVNCGLVATALSATAATPLYVSAVTAWNLASVNVRVRWTL